MRLDLLAENRRRSSCPYKGDASFFDGPVGTDMLRDIASSYVLPRPESAPIAGQICFFDEVVDIDGERQVRPRSHFT